MRFLLSTVAATALMASPALAQTLDNDVTEAPEATGTMGPGIDFSQLEQDLSGAGFSGAQELDRADVYFSTYQGQQALIIIMDEDDAGFAMDDPIDDPDVTAAVPEDDEFDDDLAADPADPAIDDDLAETPGDPAIGEDDDLAAEPADPAIGEDDDLAAEPADPAIGEDDDLAAEPADPAVPQDDDLAEAPADPGVPEDDDLAADPAFPEDDDDLAEGPDMADPDVTATTPGVGVEDDLSQAGFTMAERTDDGQVFRTTTEDGRTMYIVLAGDLGGAGVGPADPGQPEMAPESPDLEDGELEGEIQ